MNWASGGAAPSASAPGASGFGASVRAASGFGVSVFSARGFGGFAGGGAVSGAVSSW